STITRKPTRTLTPTPTVTDTPNITQTPSITPTIAVVRANGSILVMDPAYGYQFTLPKGWTYV
ncbi:MAG: hypothetical protein ACK2UB_09960, partial [Anaerolineales bacterium]